MPKVVVLNDESDTKEILSALKTHGLVLANYYTRPGALELVSNLRAALGPRADEEQLIGHELPLLVDDMPCWTSALVLPPKHLFRYKETIALATRALRASSVSGQKNIFLYEEP